MPDFVLSLHFGSEKQFQLPDRFSAFWLSSGGFFAICTLLQIIFFKMASEESVDISQFTSSGEPGTVPDAPPTDDASWADRSLEDNFDMVVAPTPAVEQMEVPDVLVNIKKKGVEFREVHFWGLKEDHSPKLVRNQSLYFSVDTVITSQQIIEAFDKAGIDVGEITCIQRRASNRSWVVTFDSPLTKEAALEVASVEIDCHTVFLGDCEHRL